uniref:NADH dehydrogenase subunit 4L n=1 Tax=Apachyus feae TaxID=2914707 RepID=UPI001EF9D8AF|nr:NADH dehydrogenase subunit 4L [Apachyus feae]UKE80570.1 NADH dehydrogenase subunit 4L [Apachyus feae]
MAKVVIVSGACLVLGGGLVFAFNHSHLLVTLMSLELIMLGVFSLVSCTLGATNIELFMSMTFLTLSVCESSVGLTIMVSVVRTHGNDYFQSFNIIN